MSLMMFKRRHMACVEKVLYVDAGEMNKKINGNNNGSKLLTRVASNNTDGHTH